VTVQTLPREDFEEHTAKLGTVVVAFLAEWCPFCTRFEDAFQGAAARHAGTPFAIADISDDDTDPRWDKYGIRVVPTVIVFRDGRPAARIDGILGRGIAPAELEQGLEVAFR
jgi:thioredoxin 1